LHRLPWDSRRLARHSPMDKLLLLEIRHDKALLE